EIEFVLFVAIGVRVFPLQVVEIEVAESERIAFIGIIIQVFGPDVVGIHLEVIAEMFADADGGTSIERFCRASSVCDGAQGMVCNRKRRRAAVRRSGWADIAIGG